MMERGFRTLKCLILGIYIGQVALVASHNMSRSISGGSFANSSRPASLGTASAHVITTVGTHKSTQSPSSGSDLSSIFRNQSASLAWISSRVSCKKEVELGYTHVNGSEWCTLWDPTCAGNMTLALDDVFSNGLIPAWGCAIDKTEQACGCFGNLGGLQHLEAFENWMKSPDCLSTRSAWEKKQPNPYTLPPGLTSCCEKCTVTGARVEVFYWPKPDADDSCLAIVEQSSEKAIDDGATTTTYMNLGIYTTDIYWGCTARHPVSGTSFITTATLASIKPPNMVKLRLVDPWDPPDCINLAQPRSVNDFGESRSTREITPHSNSMSGAWHTSSARQSAHLVTTVVMDGTTFTSPSIYARFHEITYGDACNLKTISEIFTSFEPGDLSTIDGPLNLNIFTDPTAQFKTKSLNIADLPCPPRSVMEKHWYKPEPGEAYRPLIVAPKQFTSWGGISTDCGTIWFTAVDPPKALTIAEDIAPKGSADPQASCGPSCTTSPVPAKARTSASMMAPTQAPTAAPGPALEQQPSATGLLYAAPSNRDAPQVIGPTYGDAENGFRNEHDPALSGGDDGEPKQQQTSADSDRGSEAPSPRPTMKSADDGGSSDTGPKNNDPIDGSSKTTQYQHEYGLFPEGDRSEQQEQSSAAPDPGLGIPETQPAIQYVDSDNAAGEQAPQSDPSRQTDASSSDQNSIVGDYLLPLSPTTIDDHANIPNQASLTTTLPDGFEAVVFPSQFKSTEKEQHPAQGSASVVQSNNADLPANNHEAPPHGASVSAYGTMLTAGGHPVTVSGAKNPTASLFVLSLDNNLNFIYNPIPTSSASTQDHTQPATDLEIPITTCLATGIPLVILPYNRGISIGGKTLHPGPSAAAASSNSPQSSASITLGDGTTVSLLGDSEIVLNGTRTILLPSLTGSLGIDAASDPGSRTDGSVGAAINEHFGGPASSAAGGNASRIQDFTGAAGRMTVEDITSIWLGAICGIPLLQLLYFHLS